MRILNENIMLEFDADQKQSVTIDGMHFFIVPNRFKYHQNGRETNAVVAKVILAGKKTGIKNNTYVITSHNVLNDGAYQIGANIIRPFDRWILATINKEGELIPTAEHVICMRMPMPIEVNGFWLPETAQKMYEDRVKVLTGEGYEAGEVIGILKFADYEVIYNWNGVERKRIVVYKKDIICKL